MYKDVKTVLTFLNAAQTTLAIYGSPDGPTDPVACYKMLTELLEAPELLAAQVGLAGNNFVMLMGGEHSGSSMVV